MSPSGVAPRASASCVPTADAKSDSRSARAAGHLHGPSCFGSPASTTARVWDALVMRRGTSVSGTVAWPASSTNTCVNAWLESGRVFFFASDAVGVAHESARNPALAHDATTTRAWSAASASEPLAAQNRETSDFTEAGSRRGSFTRTIVQSRSASALGVSLFRFA